MLIKVLGAGAGGGFPQWNCNGRNCRAFRQGDGGFAVATQSSLAVSSDGRNWVLLNASPDIRQQIENTPELHPNIDGPLRNSPIKAVVLTNGDIDHIAGLLSLRESQAFTLYASDRVLKTLSDNSIFDVLNPEHVDRQNFQLGHPFETKSGEGSPGLTIEPFSVPGKVALYLEDPGAGTNFGTQEGDTVGLKVSDVDSGSYFFYIPGCAHVDKATADRISGAPLVFFDGTLFTDDEMVEQELSAKTGKRMGHISMSGPGGSIAAFENLGVERRIFIHINNSNPVLNSSSSERRQVESAGWDVAYDGMEIVL